jgi:hypothetical protein
LASDFAVSAASGVQAAPALRATAQAAPGASAATVPLETELTSKSPPPVNPDLHVDLALNIVVLQFYNAQGDITQSIPSQKQLQAYQTNEASPASASSKLF